MSARALATPSKSVDELLVQNDAVSLCLLVNRRARTMRIVDFRAGPTTAKRQWVQSVAQREGIEKAFTLVERDELQTWLRIGFAREASIPGFYKRSDAYLLGCRFPAAAPVSRGGRARDDVPLQSETRLVAAPAADPALAASAAREAMERTLAAAKRTARDIGQKAAPTTKIVPMAEADARKAVAAALRTGHALTAFEPFGRDVQRRYHLGAVRGGGHGGEIVASTEWQACFGNAFIELLAGPRTEGEVLATAAVLRALSDSLTASEVLGCFALTPSDDVPLASAFVLGGFRRTGLLLSHLVVGQRRKDAIVWSRKLAAPPDE